MKSTDFIIESIGEDADEMHRDHEVQMARSDCYNAAKYAIELHKMLHKVSEQQGLDGWIQEKITLACDYLRAVHEHLSHEEAMHQSEMLPAFTFEVAEAAMQQNLSEINPHNYDSDEDYYNDLHGSGSGDSGDVDPDEDDFEPEDEPESYYEKHVRVNKLGENGSDDDYKDPEEADYGDEYQAMVSRVGQRAKEGQLNTVWDPVKRVYKNVPANNGEVDEGEVVNFPSKKKSELGNRKVPKTQPNITAPKGNITPLKQKGVMTGKTLHSIYEEEVEEEGKGLWANIHAKQERIKHGSKERMRKPGSKGAPSKQDFIDSQKTSKNESDAMEDKLRNKLAEMTAGGCSAGGFATGPTAGGNFKKTTGVPKKVKNVVKPKNVQVGKGIY